MLMELMEPETSNKDPQTTTLEHPELWNENTGIREFLSDTQTLCLPELCKASHPIRNSECAR